MTGLTIGSLFSGYGGLDRAAEHVFGARTVWVSDIDKGACKVLAHRYPHAPNLCDITRVDWATVPRVDIITGGYPCQPFSQAGRRLGQEDERHLWPYVADALAVLRPTFVLLENVRGHLSLGFDEVVRDLHQLGYDVEWVLIRASDIGACHQRARLFILGVNRERRVRSRLDRRRGLDRHQQDGSQHVCDPCPGGDGHEGYAHPALHEGRVRWQDRESSGGDGAARREGRLGRGWAGGGDVLGGDPAASDPQERAGRVCAGPVVFDPGVAESVRAQALDRRTPSPCPPPHAQGAGIECAWAGSASAGTAEGSRTDRPVPLGRVVGDGGEPAWPDTIRGKLPDEWEHDRGAPVRCAGTGSDEGPADSDLAGLQGLADQTGASPAERHRHTVAGAGRPDLTLLPTPTVSDTNGAGAHGTGGADLRTAVQLLPTPAAMNPNDGEGTASWLARRERVKLTANNGNGMGVPLTIAVQLLPTLRVENNENRQSEGYGGNRGNFHGLMPGAVSWADYAAAIARHEQAWGVPAPEPTEPGPKGNPRLSARFVEWMMMLPAGWVTDVPGVTRNQALKALGNGVVPPQAAAALRLMLNRIEAA